MVNFLYKNYGLAQQTADHSRSIHKLNLEIFQDPDPAQAVAFQFQSTNFAGIADVGQCRVNNTTTPISVIDEETNVAVAAYATFNDVGGTGAGTSVGSGMYDVLLEDGEGKTAKYHLNPLYLAWEPGLQPDVSHTKQGLAGNSFKANVPGTIAGDRSAYAYYNTNTAFDTSVNFSISVWFYPVDLSDVATNVFRQLVYRYIDASNSFMICSFSDRRVYAFVNKTAVTTKKFSGTLLVPGQWNNIILTYDASANTLSLYVNNNSSTFTATDAIPSVYTTDSNMYIGGIPGQIDKRCTGYFDTFVFWTNKILTPTEVSNMWNHGTII